MKSINITEEETSFFQYILPAMGSIQTLSLVDSILKKVEGYSGEIAFEDDEFDFLTKSINTLDQQHKIAYQCLPLVKKIIYYKGEK